VDAEDRLFYDSPPSRAVTTSTSRSPAGRSRRGAIETRRLARVSTAWSTAGSPEGHWNWGTLGLLQQIGAIPVEEIV
jgi:hypothetical protein